MDSILIYYKNFVNFKIIYLIFVMKNKCIIISFNWLINSFFIVSENKFLISNISILHHRFDDVSK